MADKLWSHPTPISVCSPELFCDCAAVAFVFDWLELGFAAIFRHHLRLQLLRAWRRPCDGIRARFDGGEDAIFGSASRCQDRYFRMMRTYACHDLRGACSGCDVDDGRTGENLAFGDFVVFRDCCDNGNVDHGHGGFDGFRWCRRVDDDACAPCISATMASSVTRGPVVVPPPTPTKSGICATVSNACVITGSPVNG